MRWNLKEAVGKTTTAVNLGVGLAKQGKKVLLIDADAQANLTMALGYNKPDDIPCTISTIMQDIMEDKSFKGNDGILRHNEDVDLLPSNIELSGLEVRLINAISRESVLKTYVNEAKKNYDYVLIDCMPSLGMMTINALAAADSVIIPTQPHYLSAKGLELLLRSVSPRIENELSKIPAKLEAAKVKRTETASQMENAKVEVEKPFVFEDELKIKSERLNALNIELNLDKKEPAALDSEPEQTDEPVVRNCANRER